MDGVAVSQTSLFKALPPEFSQYDRFIEIKAAVQAWGSRWAGVENWNASLDILFKHVLEEGYPASHRLVRHIYRHSEKGKVLLALLDELQGKLPLNPLAVALLWQYHNELVKCLVKGITILDCRLQTIHQLLLTSEGIDYYNMLKPLVTCPESQQDADEEMEEADIGALLTI